MQNQRSRHPIICEKSEYSVALFKRRLQFFTLQCQREKIKMLPTPLKVHSDRINIVILLTPSNDAKLVFFQCEKPREIYTGQAPTMYVLIGIQKKRVYIISRISSEYDMSNN